MKWFAPLVLSALASAVFAQSAVESWTVSVTPGAPGANDVLPEGLSIQADGNLSLSTRTSGPSQAKTHFSKVSFSTGLPFLHREGLSFFDPSSTAVGPGFRIAQVGYASGAGYDAAARVFSAAGTTLMSLVDNVMGASLNEQNAVSAFDGAGNLYVVGVAFPSFSTGAGSFTYVAKYSTTGVRLWVTSSGLPAVSSTYDQPVGIGINTFGDVWTVIKRGGSVHVWKLNGATGATQYGSVWQIGGITTVPVAARMINNRFVVVGNNNSAAFVRQFISPSAWITTPLDLGAGTELAHSVEPTLLGTDFFVSMIRLNGVSRTGHIERLSVAGTQIGGFSLGAMFELNQVHQFSRAMYAVGGTAAGDTVVSFVPFGVNTPPIQHPLGRPNEFTRFSAATSFGEVVIANRDTGTPNRTRLTKIAFGPQAVDSSSFYFAADVNPPTGNVMTNDLHVSGATVTIIQQPTRGTVILGADGGFVYNPEPGSTVGTYDFYYELQKPGFSTTTGREIMELRP